MKGEWAVKEKKETDCCELTLLHKHTAKLVFGPPNAKVCSKANRFNPEFHQNFVQLCRALPRPLGGATWWPPGLPNDILSLAQKMTNIILPHHHLKPNRIASLVKLWFHVDQMTLLSHLPHQHYGLPTVQWLSIFFANFTCLEKWT